MTRQEREEMFAKDFLVAMEPMPKAANEEEAQPTKEEPPTVERKPLYNVVVINGERMKVYRGEG